MNFITTVKNHLTGLPYGIGSKISLIPYDYRPVIGSIYRARAKEIGAYSQLSTEERKQFIFSRMKKISTYGYENIEFYRKFYDASNFNPNSLSCFDDIERIPVITKSDLLATPLQSRSSCSGNTELVNTGGSSGSTLDLYIQPDSVGHEWAHMHHIWARLGFRQSNLKIVFGGRSSVKNILQYDSARHQINVDIYKGWAAIANSMLALYSEVRPRYLHGYPSAIFDFVVWLESEKHELLSVLRANIDGLFLGSEFPSPQLRIEVEKILDCKSVSWYGHTERCILAYERDEPYVYVPFQTYGYCETIQAEEGEQLVGTAYYNMGTPLVRYNTEDYVKSSISDKLLDSFSVTAGRNGEFILDRNRSKIFLTALIFGRHHRLFDVSSQIQVQQVEPGKAKIFVVVRNAEYLSSNMSSMFDGRNVDLDFSFHMLERPFTSKSGKTPLLIPSTAALNQ